MTITTISREAYRTALALPDLTDAANGPHALQQLVQAAIQSLATAWGCEVLVHRAHALVSVEDNYERLLYPPEAAARDARYTRYLTPSHVLRTHTTAMIPSLLRMLAPAPYEDVLLACPGLVYRRDSIDRLHLGELHQLDLWRIAACPLDTRDLLSMVDVVVGALVPGAEHRALPASHPYTENGLEVEVSVDGRWIELLECGLAAPRILEEAGLPPDHYRGLAMGVGLDRALMLHKGVDDIRLLRSRDARVAAQMCDLRPYRRVSTMPPVARDLSVAVAADATPEELGDCVREALGERADSVESVEVLAETPIDELPPQAVERIGIRPGHKNVLVRVVLRHPTRTLTAREANELRDEVYAAIHEGAAGEWACDVPPARLGTRSGAS